MSRDRDAAHEAGHALAAISHGLTPEYSRFDEGGAVTRVEQLPAQSTHVRLCVLAAGEVAETILHGAARSWVAGSDRDQARRLLVRERYLRDDANPWLLPEGMKAWEETEHVLRKNRAHMARLASELRACLHVTGATMLRILERLPPLEPWTSDAPPIRPALDWRADLARRRHLLELDAVGR